MAQQQISRPSTAASSLDLTSLASFPLPPFCDSSSTSYRTDSSVKVESQQTLPSWTAYRQSLPSPTLSNASAPRTQTPLEDYFPHAEYFAATSTPPQRRRGSDNAYPTLFQFDESEDDQTPPLSSSYSSSRSSSGVSPFPSPSASSSSSIDSGLYNSPSRSVKKRDVGLGLWIAEQERKAAMMEQAMSDFSISALSTSSSSSGSSYSQQDQFGCQEPTLPRFDPFGSSPTVVQRASFIKFEPAPAPPVQQRIARPVAIRPQQASLLPAAVITPSHSHSVGGPFASRPTYVAPGSEALSSGCLSASDLAQISSLHNGRVPTLEQMAPCAPTAASNGLPPPIVNTGNQGRMIPQMGDWRCGACTFVNWRRRKVCMRCFPFASNDIGQSFAAQSQKAAFLASSPMAPSHSAPSFAPSPPPSSSPHRVSRQNGFATGESSPHRKMSLPEPRFCPFSSSGPYSASSLNGSYALQAPPMPRADPYYSSSSQYHYQAYEPSFAPRSPCEDLKLRRRVGGVIGYPGLAF
ncbi:zinc finger Ran-binding domain-containing protein [Sporobolomyces koalae]|uniref:zinc finger Ran-binding domain-containing protein n=1 Tax=Sporobolomyces koalae TaxID=500713 RepID=UPI00317F30FF